MKFTNEHGLPLPIFNALTADEYTIAEGDYSCTGLMNAPRQTLLSKRHQNEMVVDAMDHIWTMHGTAMHHVLENAKVEGAIKEKLIYVDLDGIKLKCQPDFIYPVEVGYALMDLKNTSIWSVMHGLKEDWIKQTNIYAYAAIKNDIPITQLQIIAILKDWSYNDCHVKQKDGYPNAPIQVIEIPFWDLDHTESYIRERIAIHEEAKFLPDDSLPRCTDEERWTKKSGWACEFISGNNKGQAAKGATSLHSAEAASIFQQERRTKAKLKNGTYKKGFVDTVVSFRAGESTRCERYCPANKFCNQYKNQDHVDPF